MINLGYENNDAAELLAAQAHVWNHIFSFIKSFSLKCAVQLGIPDAIKHHGKPITLSCLIAALPILPTKSVCIPRLMRILVHSGFFATVKIRKKHEDGGSAEEEEGFILTTASELLLSDNPSSVQPFLLAILDPVLIKPCDYLSKWFQNDDSTPFLTAHGKSLFDYASLDTRFNSLVNEATASDARLVSGLLVNECRSLFDGLKSLVDVGGGTGTVAKSIANAFPQMDCVVVFDLPHVVSGLQDSDRLKYVGGDMFEAVPPADAVLLKWVLHDWNDEECVRILKGCKEAIKGREGGKLIVIDIVIGKEKQDHQSIETQLFFDMIAMVELTGKERNEKEWAQLFSNAGLSGYKITPALGLRSLIEVYP